MKSNNKLTKEINGRTVQIILTVDGEQSADWHARHTKAMKLLESIGFERVKKYYEKNIS